MLNPSRVLARDSVHMWSKHNSGRRGSAVSNMLLLRQSDSWDTGVHGERLKWGEWRSGEKVWLLNVLILVFLTRAKEDYNVLLLKKNGIGARWKSFTWVGCVRQVSKGRIAVVGCFRKTGSANIAISNESAGGWIASYWWASKTSQVWRQTRTWHWYVAHTSRLNKDA